MPGFTPSQLSDLRFTQPLREDFLDLGYDRLGQDRHPVRALLGTGAVHHHLIALGLRCRANIVVETATARDPHQFAVLMGFGAMAVFPYLAYECLHEMLVRRVKAAGLPLRIGAGLTRGCTRSYPRLLGVAGKAKKVALVACKRKLLTIVNAMVKSGKPWDGSLHIARHLEKVFPALNARVNAPFFRLPRDHGFDKALEGVHREIRRFIAHGR